MTASHTEKFTLALTPAPLTAQAFAPYGDVIEISDQARSRLINRGVTVRYDDLAAIDVTAEEGHLCLSIFRSTPLERPIRIEVMERHPLASQAFYPLNARPYLVVVAPAGAFRRENLRAFLAGPRQGVNYRRGVWHHYSLALDAVSEFLVLDRGGPGDNLDEIEFGTNEYVWIDY